MRLSEFIKHDIEGILSEWEEFARTIPAAAAMDPKALRDHAKEILTRVAREMEHSQSGTQSAEKGRGERDTSNSGVDSAAQTHATGRLADGFSLPDMASEYRALRASVIRRWNAQGYSGPDALEDLTRFNEGIDQALTESIIRFSEKLDRARELFMGALGHDLRTPLHVIMQCAQYVTRPETATRTHAQMAAYISESAEHIRNMVEDLLDVARTKLGGSMPINVSTMDIVSLCRAAVDELKLAHPSVTFVTDLPQTLSGSGDRARLHQLVTNILRNAIQHGDATKPILLSAQEDGGRVLIEIHNSGDPIPEHLLHRLFEPLVRGEHTPAHQRGSSMGLGLYIANTIASAHRGTIRVQSAINDGTTFTVCLPRELDAS
jgi:signal transduction histidine kinase